MKIVVLAGGLSGERNVSLSSGTMVAEALRERGHRVALADLFFGLEDYNGSLEDLYDAPIPAQWKRVAREAPDLEQVRRELAELREALGALKDKAARWESGAKAYAELKDRTATIELEAHQRARAIESQAEEKAKKVRTAAEQILYKVQAGYGRLRGDVDATITHASGEMDRVDRALEQVRAEFAEHDAALERLLQSCRECTGCKAPEPLPLEDK